MSTGVSKQHLFLRLKTGLMRLKMKLFNTPMQYLLNIFKDKKMLYIIVIIFNNFADFTVLLFN